MKIDNTITLERIRRVLTPRVILVSLLIVSLLSTVLYVTLDSRSKSEVLIWFVTAEADDSIPTSRVDDINNYGRECGIDKILISRRHPEDRYFDVIMSTTAFYSCDIFIMTEEMALKYSEMDMFLPLDEAYVLGEDALIFGDESVGISLDEKYYLLINRESDVDSTILYNIIDLLRGK